MSERTQRMTIDKFKLPNVINQYKLRRRAEQSFNTELKLICSLLSFHPNLFTHLTFPFVHPAPPPAPWAQIKSAKGRFGLLVAIVIKARHITR